MRSILKIDHPGVASGNLKPPIATALPDAPSEELVGLKLRRTFSSLSEVDLSAFPDGIFHLESVEPSLKWYFRRSTKCRLYVNLHGAVDRKQIPVPVFARWNWAGILPGHMLCVSDPTLELSPDLRYGWYVGTERNDVSVMVADLVQQVAVNLGVKNRDVVFFGSSGGGFAALTCARHMEGATCLIMNCLMGDLAHRILLSSVFAPERTHEEVQRIYGHRFSILEGFSSADDLPVTLFAQNSLDPFKNNYDVFCEKFGVPLEGGISSNGRVMSTLFAAPGGHTHFPPQVLKSIIQKHLEFVSAETKSSGPIKATVAAEART